MQARTTMAYLGLLILGAWSCTTSENHRSHGPDDATIAAEGDATSDLFATGDTCEAATGTGNPTVAITSLVSPYLVQRNPQNQGQVLVAGTTDAATACAFARFEFGAQALAFPLALATPAGATRRFSSVITLPKVDGWWKLTVRAYKARSTFGSAEVQRVGVGDIYVTAGQSNATNAGQTRTAPTTGKVVTLGPAGWRDGADPQTPEWVEGSQGGSPWPRLGDHLATRYKVPIGFVSVGWGGSAIRHWQPNAAPICPGSGCVNLYSRLISTMRALGYKGFRAVLWHQGESDVFGITDNVLNSPDYNLSLYYRNYLSTVIGATRRDMNDPQLAWFVSIATYLGSLQTKPRCNGATSCVKVTQARTHIRNQQLSIINPADKIFAGPDTDPLVEPLYRYSAPDGHGNDPGAFIHFSTLGLVGAADRWAEAIFAATSL